MDKIHSPKLVCASPDLDPGTIRVDWLCNGLPGSLTLGGNDADNALEQFRAAPDDKARALLLASLIQNRRAA
jgi:hypothetical protein